MVKPKFLAILLLCSLLGAISWNYYHEPRNCFLRVFAIGSPDAYGNCIMNLTITQYNGTIWEDLLFWDNDTDWSVRVQPSLAINITVWIRLNKTLVPNLFYALLFSRIRCNITKTSEGDTWNNKIFNNTDDGSDATYYYFQERGYWNVSGKPESGVTYNVTTRYEAYI